MSSLPPPEDPTALPDKALFSPGDVFANRYRMVTCIGHSELGDVWRADDLVLETPVALKVIRCSAGPDARLQILNEVRLARQITHQAVCRVFDVGQTDEEVFYSMELVQGEDLAALLKRVGRLPSEKVIDIGRQLCAGLAAAHAQGVLHRDLKPANVLIDDDGLVRITDFGISTRRSSGQSSPRTGTPSYRAPEQYMAGGALSERTDVYALGVVLYELLVGKHPFGRDRSPASPPRPSSVVPNVNPDLDRLVMQALMPDPSDRPASVVELDRILARIQGTPAPRPQTTGVDNRSRAPLFIGIGIAAALALLALLTWQVSTPRSVTLSAQDTLVLADVENTTGDPVFDGTLKVALAVALEQSPFLKVFPDERAQETLRLMKRPEDTRITRAIAREIAEREHLKATIAGSIASLGTNYVVALEAVNAETGDVMAREQAEAASKEEVLTSLGSAASRLRAKLGESLASIEKYDVPLPRATTSSLEALQAYGLALDQGRLVPRLEAIPHLKRAIELDPQFAMAQAQLSAVYVNTGQSSLAPEFARKAFALKDRVSERERFFISWRFYRDAAQAWDKALELARSWTTTYPREAFAYNSLGSAYLRLGQYEPAVEPFRESIRLDPGFVPPYGNLGATFMALDRYDDAKAVLQQAFDQRLDFAGARRIFYLLAFVQGDAETMTRHLEASIGMRATNAAFGWRGHTQAFGGHMRNAHDQFRQGVQASLQRNFREVAGQLGSEDAEAHAIVGQCDPVNEEVTEALGLSRDNLTIERASRALALCGRDTTALLRELAERFPDATLTAQMARPVTEAIVAVEQRNPKRALELLEAAGRFDHAPGTEFFTSYTRGRAYLQLKDGQAAAAEFQRILDHRGEVPASSLYPLAHLGRARAAMLTNDSSVARKEYVTFMALWSGAEATLRDLVAARQEYARLK
jgi:eukaryotic-like serine/threonine-protein kinase